MASVKFSYDTDCEQIYHPGVGKTTLLLRYLGTGYSSAFITTVGIDSKRKHLKVGDKKIKLEVRDHRPGYRYSDAVDTNILPLRSLLPCAISLTVCPAKRTSFEFSGMIFVSSDCSCAQQPQLRLIWALLLSFPFSFRCCIEL